MAAPHEDLLALRSEFPILERTTYLINNSLGAMPRQVHDELETFATQWETRGVRAWHEGWWEMAVETGDLLAPILGVAPGHVSMHQNVSIAASIFFSCFDYPARRNRIVYTELLQSRREAATDRAEQAQAYRTMFHERAAEHQLLVPLHC